MSQRRSFPSPTTEWCSDFAEKSLQIVAAHFLHSSGNHHLYDPEAKILFSGEVGAALLPADDCGLYVTSFDRHPRGEGLSSALDAVESGRSLDAAALTARRTS